jgi:WD40 repeat protein
MKCVNARLGESSGTKTRKLNYMKHLVLILWLLFLAVNLPAQPSAQPILRIETGMHTAPIQKISTDRADRYLVTASEDKTARVWDLQSGELLRVLRGPIGEGDEGVVYAAAMSPDGNTIAVGGRIGAPNNRDILLFERATGKLINRIPANPGVVFDLAFSPDGSYLAASLGQKGVRLFETKTYQQAGQDTDYGSLSQDLEFDSSGSRLVTGCSDGFLRLYEVSPNGLTLIAKKTLLADKAPKPAFSPDGTKIAVSFYHTKKQGWYGPQEVMVVSAKDLSLLYSPDISDGGNAEPKGYYAFLTRVAWSFDGSILYGGISYGSGDTTFIRFWTNGGQGGLRQARLDATVSVSDIQPLRNGSIIYSTYDPGWGIVDPNGKTVKSFREQLASLLYSYFQVSADATEFQFSAQGPNSLASFSIIDKRLGKVSDIRGTLFPPVAVSINISSPTKDIEFSVARRLREPGATSALAIAADESKFLLGTAGGGFRLFDRIGQELWKVSTSSTVAELNFSKDGRLGLTTQVDGTIRWYRMTDGKELLAFFPHKDGKRWVLWTPSGYYDASAYGEELIGWHVNNGQGAAADFYPVGLFRSRFYRPDVVSKILSTLDEAIALNLADKEAGRKEQQVADVAQQLPPVVEILSPRDGTEVSNSTIKIGYLVRSGSGEPVTNLKVLIDGRPLARDRGAGNRPAGASEVTVTIPEKDSEVAIIAENRFASSTPAIVKLKWKGKTGLTTDEFVVKPKLYILAVGVSKYQNADYNLGFAAKDAVDFAAAMKAQEGALYREVVVKSLTDQDATRDNIVDGLEWIRLQTTSKDVAMVFIAGHGTNDTLNRYYFLPHNYNPDRLSSTGVTFTDIRNALEAIAGKAVFFVDSCHSGNAVGTAKSRSLPDINGLVNELSSAENGAVVFAASTGKQVSLEDVSWNNGAFTKAVVEGLKGGAVIAGKGKITINSLDLYISERVKELTRGQQTPTTTKPNTVQDFPIAAKF